MLLSWGLVKIEYGAAKAREMEMERIQLSC